MSRAMTAIMSGCLAIAAAAPARDFYVSTTGDDNNSGTIEKLFATPERARRAVWQQKDSEGLPAGGVTVNIRGGMWFAAPDAYAMGYWRHGWANRIERIAKIDTQSKTITLEKAPGYGIIPKKPYYVINLIEEIDTPGEWWSVF